MLITIERNRKAKVTVKDLPSSAPDYSSLAALLAERMIAETKSKAHDVRTAVEGREA